MFLAKADRTPETIAARFDEIADPKTARPLDNAFGQTFKFVETAAKRARRQTAAKGRLMMREAVIVSTARTPIGRAYRGAFNDTQAQTLGGHAIEHAVKRAGVDPARSTTS